MPKREVRFSNRNKILNGDIEGARADMGELGIKPRDQTYYIRQTQRPGPTPSQQKQFLRNAPPEWIPLSL